MNRDDVIVALLCQEDFDIGDMFGSCRHICAIAMALPTMAIAPNRRTPP
jgi:hypothetical protein